MDSISHTRNEARDAAQPPVAQPYELIIFDCDGVLVDSERITARVFADMLGDPVADTILDALRAAGSAGLTRTKISNLFSRNAAANQIARALGELARRGLAGQRKGDAATGRPAEIWIATGGRA